MKARSLYLYKVTWKVTANVYVAADTHDFKAVEEMVRASADRSYDEIVSVERVNLPLFDSGYNSNTTDSVDFYVL